VPRAIRAYREAHPLVALSLEENGTGELVDALAQERLDAAFVRSPIGPVEGIAVHSVLEEAMIAALPAGHTLAGRAGAGPLTLAELAAETFILYRRPLGPGLYDAIIAACQRAGYSPKIGQEAPRMLATLSLVAAGLGVTLVPQSMRRLRVHGVVYRRLDGAAGLIAPLNLAYRRGDASPAARRFIALARAGAAAQTAPPFQA
jgi:DNA-binding transcriptional LysR family regulator